MSSLPSNQTVFVWQVPDRDPDRTLERVKHLKKHFSRLDPDMTVTHEPSTRIHAGIACTAITLGTSRLLVRDQLPSDFDLRTYRKGAFHWRGLYPTHPLQSSVLLVGNDGSTIHHIQHTLGEFHNLDNDPELFRMSLLTHMVTPPLVGFHREDYNNHVTPPRKMVRDVVRYKVGNLEEADIFESLLGVSEPTVVGDNP